MDDLRKEEPEKKLDILDQWLKQTLNIGKMFSGQPDKQPQQTPNQQNQPGQSTVQSHAAAPRPQQTAHHGQQTAHHGQQTQRNLGNLPANQKKPQLSRTQQTPAKGQQPVQAIQKGQYGNIKNKFKWRHQKDNPSFKGNFNQRHKFQVAIKKQRQEGFTQLDPRGKLRIIPIGGLDEVGKNTMILEYEDSIILIDLGFQFPEADMLGVDYVIPDITYLKDKVHKIKGIVVTHGHLDHIGGIPYLLPKLGYPPIFAGKLTMGLIQKQLEEHGLLNQATLRVFKTDETFQFGKIKVSMYRITHSIPDSVGLFIETPAGSILHTGDFKIDLSPAGNQVPPDFAKITAFGEKGVTLMMSDSTNATKPGFTISEKKIGETLEHLIKDTPGRIIIASFASQIGRIQQIIDAAVKHNKKIFLSGRSLIDNSVMAAELGYLKYPQGLISDVKKAKKTPPNKTIILTTGSQGEPVAALSRMALDEHPHVQIGPGDTVVLSSSPIPGNEMAVVRVINNLSRLGARIIHNKIMDVHASGHGQQEDLKLMFALVRPKYFMPVHGEFFMRKAHGEIMVKDLDLPADKMIMVENGDVLEMRNGEVKVTNEKVSTKYILVDGLGGGDIGSQVMMDRQILAENGVVILIMRIDKRSQELIGEINVETRGFIYMEESKEILNGIVKKAREAFYEMAKSNPNFGLEEMKMHIRESVDQYSVSKIDRQPLILPLILTN